MNSALDELTFTAEQNSGGSATITASVKDNSGLSSVETATLNLVVTDNSPPSPGGSIATKPGGLQLVKLMKELPHLSHLKL